ncbi:4,5-dihydroxyphthalate decarboxylase [Rhizobium albus]|nr:4,5-dihydroxyphthalate decarboxylase [Rhizobium albus]
MSTLPKITVACFDHDRVMPVMDGRVPVKGFEIEPHVLPTSKLFPLAVQEARFDVTELSLSSHILQVARGEGAYVAIPAFISRAFRHNGFFRRTDSGIETPADLKGRRVGVPEYQMTAALWMRGILKDQYGVEATDIEWHTGALDAGVRHERLQLTPPPNLKITPISEGETLQSLLLDGQIDALLAPNPPKAFAEGDPRIERIFPDFERVEQDYNGETGFFPIMHVVAVRRTLAEKCPELPMALYEAFSTARDLALKRLEEIWLGSANRLSLPWLNASMERLRATMGRDYYAYGFKGAEREVEAMCRYSVEQYLAPRRVEAAELFHPSLLNT